MPRPRGLGLQGSVCLLGGLARLATPSPLALSIMTLRTPSRTIVTEACHGVSDTLGSARPRLGATVTQAGTPTVGAARLTKLGWPPARARVRRAADPKSNVCIEIRIPSRRRNLSESLVRISLNL